MVTRKTRNNLYISAISGITALGLWYAGSRVSLPSSLENLPNSREAVSLLEEANNLQMTLMRMPLKEALSNDSLYLAYNELDKSRDKAINRYKAITNSVPALTPLPDFLDEKSRARTGLHFFSFLSTLTSVSFAAFAFRGRNI